MTLLFMKCPSTPFLQTSFMGRALAKFDDTHLFITDGNLLALQKLRTWLLLPMATPSRDVRVAACRRATFPLVPTRIDVLRLLTSAIRVTVSLMMRIVRTATTFSTTRAATRRPLPHLRC